MDLLDKYLVKYSSSHCAEALKYIKKETSLKTNHVRMLSGPVQGEFLYQLVKISSSKRILELGTFTGYSSVLLASALPPDGHLDTFEINDELEGIIRGVFDKFSFNDKITLHIGDCKDFLASAQIGFYDLIYMDANKREYPDYYQLCLPLVRSGGLIVADNVLWSGKVYDGNDYKDEQSVGIEKFNEMIACDPRVENVILPLRDGLNIIRKL